MQEVSAEQRRVARLPFGGREIAILLGLILLAGVAIWMLATQFRSASAIQTGKDLPGANRLAFEELTGIQIQRISLSAGGGLIDIRYQVVDPDKWLQVHDDFIPPKLLIHETGDIIGTRFHEHTHASFSPARVYNEILVNPDGVLKSGMHVTFIVREFKLENIPVE